MKHDIVLQNGVIIPDHELEITASRSGGAGGQHVNKTSTRITVRWNIKNTNALTPEHKERLLYKLHGILTHDGDLIIHSSESRSQQHNKEAALKRLVQVVEKALAKQKKRVATRIPHSMQEARLQEKARRSGLKKMRTYKIQND